MTTTRWCFTCAKQMPADHEHPPGLFDPVPLGPGGLDRPVDARANYVGSHHPDTAQAMGAKALPRSGTFRREVFGLIEGRGGLSDDELEALTGRSHQSVSGARSTLKADGHVRDSGRRRTNRYGNVAIVWEVVR